jgi:hypothetical protein
MKKLIIAGVSAVAILAGGGAAFAAVTSSGPGVNPGTVNIGPYYKAGPVSICVSQANEGVIYVEEHTQVLGNCAAGYVQLTVTASPLPTASPTP